MIISSALFLAYVENTFDINKIPFLIKTNILFSLLFIPLLVIYLKKITSSYNRKKSTLILLFLPFLVVLLYNLPFYFSDINTKLSYYNVFGFKDKLEDIFIQISITLFGLIAIFDVKKYKERIDNYFSEHEKAKVHWLKFISYSIFTLSFVALIIAVLQIFNISVSPILQFVTAIASTFIVYYMAYFLFFHPNALIETSETLNNITKEENENIEKNDKEYKVYSEIEKKIIFCIEEEKLYLNPDLSISDVAEKIGFPQYLTSKVINQNLNTNFYNLINHYRLENVKHELIHSENKTIIEIAYQSGFNSKTTFYEVFKKQIGITPSEFIQQNKFD